MGLSLKKKCSKIFEHTVTKSEVSRPLTHTDDHLNSIEFSLTLKPVSFSGNFYKVSPFTF
jgi:hypothetical protein